MPLTDEQVTVLIRLTTDGRMERVWSELGRLRRNTDEYLHPAQPPAHAPPRSPHAAQQSAMAETLHFAYRSASDGRRTTTVEETTKMRADLRLQAAMLRKLAARTPGDGSLADLVEAGSLMRRAARLEAEAAEFRGPDDPLTVVRHTTDPRSRGVQIDISGFFMSRFGDRLDATTGTLAAVALGVRNRNLSASRSALSPPKRRK